MPNLSGTKWGGGPLGTAGGVVTWSLAPAGSDVSLFNISTSTSVSSDGVFGFDVRAAISQAFADWSSHGNIEFIQTEDPGGAAGAVRDPDIRIFFGPIAGGTIGLAFFPSNFSSSAAGDILLDTSSSFVMNPENFNGLALHEIGHSLGLDHVSSNSVLTPSLTATSLQPDDILGIQQVYGVQDNEAAVYDLSTFERDINILESLENLTVNGNNSSNRIDATSAAESIFGRSGNDELIGRGGNDALDGGEGIDTLLGGNGNDTLDGGAGIDTASYADANNNVSVDIRFDGRSTQGAGRDSFVSIENVVGSDFNDRLSGDSAANVLDGGGGNDTLRGQGGEDTLIGGEGDDNLRSGDGADDLRGDAGSDTLSSLSGHDELTGGTGDDFLFGGQGNDTLFGNQDDDRLRGNLGNDILEGGEGIDDLRGGGGNDVLFGGADADFLLGENGADTLDGGAGNDVLRGGFGDVLDGVTDTFVFAEGYDFDSIRDFENGTDLIDVQSFGFENFAEVQALAEDRPSGLRIDFGGGDVLFINDFTLAELDQSDVIL